MQGMLQPAVYICMAQAFKATTWHHFRSAVASKEGNTSPTAAWDPAVFSVWKT